MAAFGAGRRVGSPYWLSQTVLKYSTRLPAPTKPCTFEVYAPGGVELTSGTVGMSCARRSCAWPQSVLAWSCVGAASALSMSWFIWSFL